MKRRSNNSRRTMRRATTSGQTNIGGTFARIYSGRSGLGAERKTGTTPRPAAIGEIEIICRELFSGWRFRNSAFPRANSNHSAGASESVSGLAHCTSGLNGGEDAANGPFKGIRGSSPPATRRCHFSEDGNRQLEAMHPARKVSLKIPLMDDAAARSHPLNVAGRDGTAVAHAIAVLNSSRQDIRDEGATEPSQIILGNVVAERPVRNGLEVGWLPNPEKRGEVARQRLRASLDLMSRLTGRMDILVS